MNKKVGIIGFGWVGQAMKKLFPEAIIYDPYLKTNSTQFSKDEIENLKFVDDKEEINKCDVVFISVPTPCPNEGKLDTSIVEECVKWCNADLLVIRSTVNPGDCQGWSNKYGKNIIFQPEYLGETPSHPLMDQKSRPFIIIGGNENNCTKLINLYFTVYNANVNVRQMSLLEAEIVKLSENRAIAFKVAQCQELYDACQLAEVNYYKIREAVYSDDPRFNLWWTLVYPDKRGFQSKCIPKDVYAWCAWTESLGYKPEITRGMLERNKKWLLLNKEQ